MTLTLYVATVTLQGRRFPSHRPEGVTEGVREGVSERGREGVTEGVRERGERKNQTRRTDILSMKKTSHAPTRG